MSRLPFVILVVAVLALVAPAFAFDFVGDGEEYSHRIDITGMVCRPESVTVTANKFIIYSDTTEIGDTLVVEELVVTDHLSGDSLSVTATKTLIYSDSVVVEDTLLVKDVKVTGGIFGDSLSITATEVFVYSNDVDFSGDSVNVTDTLVANVLDVTGEIQGDSLAVDVGSYFNYADTIWTLGGCSGIAILTAADDSVGVACACMTADTTTSAVYFTVLPATTVGTIVRKYHRAGELVFASTGNETADIPIQYKVERIGK